MIGIFMLIFCVFSVPLSSADTSDIDVIPGRGIAGNADGQGVVFMAGG